jgi:hypothetical protein
MFTFSLWPHKEGVLLQTAYNMKGEKYNRVLNWFMHPVARVSILID